MKLIKPCNMKIIFFILILAFSKTLTPRILINNYLNELKKSYVDFEYSLKANITDKEADFKKLYNPKKTSLDILKKNYLKNNFNNLKITDFNNLKIPKIIHQIWLGSPFPDKYKEWQESWKKFHPDWTYQLWTEKEVKQLKLYNQDLYNKTINYGEKSDILRYEILYQFGGLYVDTDFECLKSFDPLNYAYEFYTGLVTLNRGAVINNALIGSVKGHSILKEFLLQLNNHKKHSNLLARTGPLFFSKIIIDYISSNKNHNQLLLLPPTYFYSLPSSQDIPFIMNFLKPESFAVHYWENSFNKKHN